MLNVFLELATEAGSIIRTLFEKGDYKTEIKEDNSPVTTADYKANELIVKGLKRNFPKIPIISEESKHENVYGDEFFLVDPLDGTREFLKGSRHFSVNIAFEIPIKFDSNGLFKKLMETFIGTDFSTNLTDPITAT